MDDLISRQAVNDALDRTCNLVCQYSKKQRYAMCGACPLGSAFDVIAEVPSIEQKKGKWIWMGESGDSRFMCSVCHSKENVPTCNGEPTVWEFCPNCGARMEGEQ